MTPVARHGRPEDRGKASLSRSVADRCREPAGMLLLFRVLMRDGMLVLCHGRDGFS
jgi:hypothetical protein